MEHRRTNLDAFTIQSAARYLVEVVIVTLAITAFTAAAEEGDRAANQGGSRNAAFVCGTPAADAPVTRESSAPFAAPGPRP